MEAAEELAEVELSLIAVVAAASVAVFDMGYFS